MCGIVGYTGKRPAVPVILSGLRRMEYRGYDSAGLALHDGERGLLVSKRQGRVNDFAELLQNSGLMGHQSCTGIGHTRWATHGVPSDQNAHPHLSCRKHVAIVHNGIINNFADLKRMLVGRGHIFRSETDTEVLAHLIGEYLDGDPVEAVRTALVEVQGTYGLAVLFRNFPGQVVFARNGSPLCIGHGDGEFFVASDPASFLEFTRQQTILEDGQIGQVSPDSCRIVDMERVSILPKVERIEFELAQVERGGYDHFMLKEICEQPTSIANALAGRLLKDGNVKLGGLDNQRQLLESLEHLLFVASGTSLHAAMIGKILLQEVCRLPANWENASELANQLHPVFPPHTAVWAISQSGETADLLLAMNQVLKLGLPVLGLCNVVGSSVARRSCAGVYVNAGPEIGVASTKAFTAQVTALQLVALYLRQLRRLGPPSWLERFIRDLQAIPGQVEELVAKRQQVAELAARYYQYKDFLYLGRGINYPVALEGALKLKEISYCHAEGYSSGEMKHGPLALIDEKFPTLVIIPSEDDLYDKIVSNILEIKARRGPVVAIATEGDSRIADLVDDVLYVPHTSYYLTPLLTVVPLQLFAYYVAANLGRNIDQPRNLAKAVTVE